MNQGTEKRYEVQVAVFTGSDKLLRILSLDLAFCALTIKRVILTGGPGAGKTSVLEVLRDRGFAVGKDIARTIIRERKAVGLSPRPAPAEFAEQILEREIARYGAIKSEPTFFERGVTEAIASVYGAGSMDIEVATRLMDNYRYDRVFIFPPWAEIYRTDAERDHTYAHAISVYDSIRRWYLRFGYETIEVPFDSESVRTDFILARATGT